VSFPLVSGFGEGLKRAGTTLRASDAGGQLQWRLREAAVIATDPTRSDPARRVAIEILALVPYADAAPALLAVLERKNAAALQSAAITALAQFRDIAVGAELLKLFPGLSASLRARVIEAVLERPERIDALWLAFQNKTVRPADLAAAQVNALRRHRDERVRARAAEWLGAAGILTREDVYKSYLPALRETGVASRGKPIFEARCATCHRHAGGGFEFGPDLAVAQSGGKEKLLSSLVDPNREVLPQFVAYAVETKEGENVVGFLERDTAAAVTLRQPGGIRKTIARASITSLKSQERSLMPEGLEAGLSPQEIADLLEFVINPGG
jgi:putative heme-binding domain-containing protein